MAHNIQMPLFASVGMGANSGAYSEGDNFDVDMLAEYLLEDGAFSPGGVTFDFNLDSKMQQETLSTVSPENSEDGYMPPVAESSNMFFSVPDPTPLPPPQQFAGGVPMPQMQQMGQQFMNGHPGLVHHQHDQQPLKRARLEDPMMAQSSSLQAAAMLSGQQLAVAAAQAMAQGRGRKKSQAQIDRRRERNRILARRTRLRKKFFFESLQKEVMELQAENLRLKSIVKSELDADDSKMILDECDAMERVPEIVTEAIAEESALDKQDFNLVKSIQKSQHNFVITDPSLNDNPIVYASDGFLTLTGYSREQVLGRNCRFLQGELTSKDKLEQIRKGLSNGEDVSVTLINYTVDGIPFWNKLFIAALRDSNDNIVNYIGVLVQVASPEPNDPEFGVKLEMEAEPGDIDDDGEAEDTAKAVEGALSAAVAAAASGPM